jgi:hypothetical protein
MPAFPETLTKSSVKITLTQPLGARPADQPRGVIRIVLTWFGLTGGRRRKTEMTSARAWN